MSENNSLQRCGGVTVLRRNSVLAALIVTLAAAPASAAQIPAKLTDDEVDAIFRVIVRLEKIAKGLEGAASSCKKAAKVVEKDTDRALDTLVGVIRGLDLSDSKVATWLDREVSPAMKDITMSKAWRACADDKAFGSAVEAHPILKNLRAVDRKQTPAPEPRRERPSGISAKEAKSLQAFIASRGVLAKKLRQTKGCAARAKVVKAHSNRSVQRAVAAYTRLIHSADDDVLTWVVSTNFDALDADGTKDLVAACSKHDAFMKAALLHPILKDFATVLDKRPKPQPRSITARQLKQVDKTVARLTRAGAGAARSDDCDDIAEQAEIFHDAREQLVTLIQKHRDERAQNWLFDRVGKRLQAAHEQIADAKRECRPE